MKDRRILLDALGKPPDMRYPASELDQLNTFQQYMNRLFVKIIDLIHSFGQAFLQI
ncbi:hypothetical protein [Paenibacillus sp. BGI2013]|uniref:hypothetical protein n=1 Tax=Paenibacillus sp. BGI2013 TaxID=2058902 RepID=UPI0015D5EEAC|nr:hypothetical protein [Paenibacillus sp. BGI2013]